MQRISLFLEEYIDHTLVFLDILGYKNIIKAGGEKAEKLLSIQKELYTNFELEGYIEVNESRTEFRPKLALLSDTLIFSYPTELCRKNKISPVESLVKRIPVIQFKLLANGFLCRGSLVRGDIYHSDNNQCFGIGLCLASDLETEDPKYPLIKISPDIDIRTEVNEFYQPSIILLEGLNFIDFIYHYGWAASGKMSTAKEFIEEIKTVRSFIAEHIKDENSDGFKNWKKLDTLITSSLSRLKSKCPETYKDL